MFLEDCPVGQLAHKPMKDIQMIILQGRIEPDTQRSNFQNGSFVHKLTDQNIKQ